MQENGQAPRHELSPLEILLIVVLLQLSSIVADKVSDALPSLGAKVAGGLWIVLVAILIAFEIHREKITLPRRYLFVVTWLVLVGVVLVLGGWLKWLWPDIAAWAGLAALVSLVLTGVRGLLRQPRIQKAVQDLGRWMRRSLAPRPRRLIRAFSSAFSRVPSMVVRRLPASRIARVFLLLIASLVLIGVFTLLRERVGQGLNGIVSWILAVRQSAKNYEDRVVVITLGLASLSVILAALITTISDRYRRLAAVFQAVAILAMAMFFCTYTAPKIAEVIIPSTPAPALTSSPTPSPTLTQVGVTGTPLLIPTDEPGETPTPTVTERPMPPTPVAPSPTWTPIPSPQPKTPPPVDTPTRIQPPTSVPTEIPTPTRIQPPTSVPTEVPTPTRIQPPPPPPAEIPTPTRIQPQTSMAVLTGRSSSNYQVPR